MKLRGHRIELGEIESLLAQHPAVRQSVVCVREDTSGDKRLVAYVVPDIANQHLSGQGSQSDGDQESQWQMVWDETYKGGNGNADLTFNTIGWNSSYSDSPIPPEEMREWLERTIERISYLKPKRVLEIGCGSGMILFRVAPMCSEYMATDISGAAVAAVRETLSVIGEEMSAVTLLERSADDFSGFQPEQFDVVILNSVIQYFPSATYLQSVLKKALEVVAPGGAIFIGDVRNYALIEALHSSVQLQKAPASSSIEDLKQRIQQKLMGEKELLVAPEFFISLKEEMSKLGRVEIELKQGRYQNELSRFRYDVTLRVGASTTLEYAGPVIDLYAAGSSLEEVKRLLVEDEPASLWVKRVRNGRLAVEMKMLEKLSSAKNDLKAGELRTEVMEDVNHWGVEPDDLQALGKELGYSVEVCWSKGGKGEFFDVLFNSESVKADERPLAEICIGQGLFRGVDKSVYTNHPSLVRSASKLAPELRNYLKERVPEYMVPSAFVEMTALPLTANGKVDRKVLPAPSVAQTDHSTLAQLSPVQEIISNIWQEVLNLGPIAADENFFELGGHSLLATQVVSRIREVLKVDLSLRVIFEQPTVRALAQAAQVQMTAGQQQEVEPIEAHRRDENNSLPLSYAQQRLWFIHQLEPESAAYNIAIAVRLEGEVAVEAVRQSLEEIARRHEVLRTRYRWSGREARQEVMEGAGVEVRLVDVSGMSVDERERVSREVVRQEAMRRVEIEEGPVWRARVVKLGEREHVLVVVIDHIASDGWSMGLMVREFVSLYESNRGGRSSELKEMKIQYGDYAVWQRRWMEAGELDRQMSYWKERLKGIAMLELPTDRPRYIASEQAGAKERFTLSVELTNDLKVLSRREGVTLFMAVLAGFNIVFSRYAGQEDVSIGTDVANRNRLETEDLIGFFVNQLVLRSDLSGNPTFRELLVRVRETTLGAYAHQDLPFEKLVEELALERDLARTPLFQVKIEFMNQPRGNYQSSGIKFSRFDVEQETLQFDLTLTLAEINNCLAGNVEYATNLYDRTTVTRMLEHLRVVFQTMVIDCKAQIDVTSLLSAAERHQLLVEWKDTGRACGKWVPVHEIFEKQAEASPHSVAIITEEEHLSYATLNARANRLAHILIRLGVSNEDVVAILLEKSSDFVASLLGVMKAGAAYLPLDPEYSEQRLNMMLSDSNSIIAISTGGLQEKLGAGLQHVIDIEGDLMELNAQDEENPCRIVQEQNLAYVMFTSGSTGRPKGIMIHHQSFTSYINAISDELQIRPDDRMLQFASAGFDVALEEIFPALTAGASVMIYETSHLSSFERFEELLAARQISLLELPTAYWHEWVADIGKRQFTTCRNLRAILVGGERMSPDKFLAWQSLVGVPVLHVYGLTETTVTNTMHRLDRLSPGRTAPIGYAIANSTVCVMDVSMNVAPIGAVGELCVGGDGVARGYVIGADQTAERFIPDWYGGVGRRLYRTGDIGRHLRDGTLEIVARIDNQAKIRGYRVEPAEVETALMAYPGIEQCTVQPRTTADESNILVAYYVGEPGRAGEFRSFLKKSLPEHMIPSAFVHLTALPLTANGKVDRKVLPAPSVAQTDHSTLAQLSPVQEIISNIWQEVLNLGPIAADENFFELGGHSLLATQVVSRIREVLKVDLSLRVIFEQPTVRALAQAAQVQMVAGQQQEVEPIEAQPRDGDQSLPLSYAQQRLWFIHQLEPESAAYNIAIAVRLEGEVAIEAVRQSLEEIARRHEVLRTRYRWSGREARQEVMEGAGVEVRLVDVSGMRKEERERVSREVVRQEAMRRVEIEEGPVWRARVVKLGEREHVLVVVIDHIASDGWSMGLMVREFVSLYESNRGGRSSELKEMKIQYADYAVWQRRWLQGERLGRERRNWIEHLASAPTELRLPTDRPPAEGKNRGSGEKFELSSELSESLNVLSRREGATAYMTLLTAFNILLSRYTGQEDIVVGSPIANRNREELEPLIGFFVNTLALRTKLNGTRRFNEALRKVREVSLEAYAHQEMPFELLVEELNPERNLSQTPLFQVMFMMENKIEGGLELIWPSVTWLPAETGAEKFALTMIIRNDGQDFQGLIRYNADLFDDVTVKRMAVHYKILLQRAATDATFEIWDTDLLSDAERHQVQIEWNNNEVAETDRDRCVHQSFEQQAAKSPDAIALVCDDERLTYGELNRRANQLASYLQSLAVGPESLVAIFMERSAEMIVALLGTLKAGGAYLPIDTAYPKERVLYMLEDARVAALLTQNRLLKQIPESAVRIISLDQDWPAITSRRDDNPTNKITGDNLAYVIYTSGSTGKPKGVQVSHRNLLNLICWHQHDFKVTAADKATQLAGVAFDASVWELWPYLTAGASIDLPGEEIRSTPALLKEWLVAREITISFLPTPLAESVLSLDWQGATSLRLMLTGGDKLHRHPSIAVPFELINNYGPTENTVVATSGRVAVKPQQETAPTIGSAISNVQVYILDSHFMHVPTGVPGELHIGGANLARGYLNQSGLTAERFAPDPFNEMPGARLYKTGDMGLFLPNREIVFLGRADHQVKVRGYRIELGEIEATLLQHDSVREAVVIARDGSPSGTHLVGYVVTHDPKGGADGLREYLRERLPDYMVPAAVLVIEQMPLTANGKVDRRALPAPVGAQASDESDFPRSPAEEILAGIWAEVLNLEQVGVFENFFELGGHSLLATQVILRVREVMNMDVPLKVMFERPTVAGFAEVASQNGAFRNRSETMPIRRAGRDREVPLSFAQQRLWFIQQLEPNSVTYNIPISVRLHGALNIVALRQSLEHIERRHEVLRTRFAMRGAQPIQLIREEVELDFSIWDVTALGEKEREREAHEIARQEARRPFDLQRGPVWRVAVGRIAPDDQVLVLTIHHIASDAWLMGLLLKEFAALYEAYAEGRAPRLPEMRIQYADYAVWQREWLQGEVLEDQLGYWRRQLSTASPLELPTDWPRPAELGSIAGIQPFSISAELTERLKVLSRHEGVSLFMTLLAAFATILGRYSDQEDVVIGTDVANRNRLDIEGLIGFFVNQLALRTDLSGNPTFRELLRRVRQTTLEAYAHQDLPFERLVEELAPQRHMGQMPLFQVRFLLHNAPPIRPAGFHSLTAELFPLEAPLAKFDISFHVIESKDGLQGTFEYRPNLFASGSVIWLLELYKNLLAKLIQPESADTSVTALMASIENEIRSTRHSQQYELFRPASRKDRRKQAIVM